MKRLVLDGEKLTNRQVLHDTLAEGLQFPDWYGRNLDALFDCLTEIQEETEIMLCHGAALNANLGNYAGVLVKVLMQAAEENSCIHVSEASMD